MPGRLLAVGALGLVALVPPARAGDPLRAQHYIFVGVEAMKVGEMGKAKEAFERARASDPALPMPDVFLGQIAMAQQRFDDAEGCFLRAIELYKKADAARRLASERDAMQTQDDLDLLSTGLGESGGAGRRGMSPSDVLRQETERQRVEQKQSRDERDQTTAMTETPVPADVYLYLGNARMRAGRAAPAAEAYREAIARAPDAAEPHHNLAAALAASGRLPEALAECRTAETLGFRPSKQLREQIEQALAASAPPTDAPKE